ncbi:MAG TPA: hypothetical protein VFK73_05745 [Paludibacter sp.]|nr:hypothetical protein [Paludibacter sp.]
MTEITLPYHLFIPTLICIGILILMIFNYKSLLKNKRYRWLWICFALFLVLYIFIVGSATILDIYYQWDLNRYDSDKDGFFAGEEITQEQQVAMQKLTNDLGRNLTFITGFMFSIIISVAVYISGIILNKAKQSSYS